MINGIGIVGFRDPHGIRPLVFGTREKTKVTGATKDYVVSSESVVMDMLGFDLLREFSFYVSPPVGFRSMFSLDVFTRCFARCFRSVL